MKEKLSEHIFIFVSAH